MNLDEARALARDLTKERMNELESWKRHSEAGCRAFGCRVFQAHSLRDPWLLSFSPRLTAKFGVCRYARREIVISAPLSKLNDERHVRDTVLHEIAHALVGGRHGHDAIWRHAASAIGAEPKRCYDPRDVRMPASVRVAFCARCKWARGVRYRDAAGRYCRACRGPVVLVENTRRLEPGAVLLQYLELRQLEREAACGPARRIEP